MSGAATTPEPETWTPYKWDSVEHCYDTDGWVVRLKGFPGVFGCGDTREEAFDWMLKAATDFCAVLTGLLNEAEAKLGAPECGQREAERRKGERRNPSSMATLARIRDFSCRRSPSGRDRRRAPIATEASEPAPASPATNSGAISSELVPGERVSEEERERERLLRQIARAAFAITMGDHDEAYHQLYIAAEPTFTKLGNPFAEWMTPEETDEFASLLRTSSARPEPSERVRLPLGASAGSAGDGSEGSSPSRSGSARPADLEAISRDIVADGAWFTAETPSELADRFRAILARHLAPTSDTEAE